MAEQTTQENIDILSKSIRSLETDCNDKYPSAERIELLAKLAKENFTATEIKEVTVSKLLKEMVAKRHPEAPADKVDAIIAQLTKQNKTASDLSALEDLKALSKGDNLVYETGKELLGISASKDHMREIATGIGIMTNMNAALANQFRMQEEETKKEMSADTSNDPELKKSFDSSLQLYRSRKEVSCQDASIDLKTDPAHGPNKIEKGLQNIIDAGKSLDSIHKLFKRYGGFVLEYEDRLKELEKEERRKKNKPVA